MGSLDLLRRVAVPFAVLSDYVIGKDFGLLVGEPVWVALRFRLRFCRGFGLGFYFLRRLSRCAGFGLFRSDLDGGSVSRKLECFSSSALTSEPSEVVVACSCGGSATAVTFGSSTVLLLHRWVRLNLSAKRKSTYLRSFSLWNRCHRQSRNALALAHGSAATGANRCHTNSAVGLLPTGDLRLNLKR